MKNSHLKSLPQNNRKLPRHIKSRPDSVSPKMASTFQMRVSSKNEIIFNPREYKELRRVVHERIDLENPSWLRRKSTINQCKRKFLNEILCEAGCDSSICNTVAVREGWSADLHSAWHRINGVELCR
jgi:hypothetical protein